MLLCDGCDRAFHTFCLQPKLATIPEADEWFCQGCVQGPSAGLLQGPLRKDQTAEAAVATGQGPCSICTSSTVKSNLVECMGCGDKVHTTCLGLSKHAFPGGVFTCAECHLLDAKIAPGHASSAAKEAAHTLVLVWLAGKRVRDSSQATYAAGLHRYVHYARAVLQLGAPEALPEGRHSGPNPQHVQLFVGWAAHRFKIATIKSTPSALIDWCRSKGVPPDIQHLLKTVEAEQGPAGLPVGKLGMDLQLLRLLISHCAAGAVDSPSFAPLLLLLLLQSCIPVTTGAAGLLVLKHVL